jgi:spore coat polysaccharide biosynthesis protein SpsF
MGEGSRIPQVTIRDSSPEADVQGALSRGPGAVVILARLDSARLPGKALRPVAGRELLGRVIDRVRLAVPADAILVATSDREIDDPIAKFVSGEGISVFRGSVNDVAGRCLACAEVYGLGYLVRISGDSPFIDPSLIQSMMQRFESGDADIVTNVFPRGFPPGMSVEVIAVAALRRIIEASDDPADREHVTVLAYRDPTEFKIDNVAPETADLSGVALTIDTEADLARAEWIASEISSDAGIDEILEQARRHASLVASDPNSPE